MIKTRFSPSPTGMIHLGNVRAALFSKLFATKEKGIFLLRIEDTDQARSETRFTEILQQDLRWLGLDWSEGPQVDGPHSPYYQSERGAIYAERYEALEKMGRAYPCFCSDEELALHRKLQLSRGHAPRYPGTCKKLSKDEVAKRLAAGKKPALRFSVPPNEMIEFVDLIKGPQRFNSDDIGDFIIRRADGSASFMFCNAMDDSLMQVTHVIRGEDHLANTPRQLMMLLALEMRSPAYGHLSLITGEDGAKLSKRHGSFSLHDLREEGYLPIAVVNYLSRLSHSYDQHDLMSFHALAEHFDLQRISRASARFDTNQLLHWQKEAVLRLHPDEAWVWLGDNIASNVPKDKRHVFIEVMRQNILFPAEAESWIKTLFGDTILFNSSQKQILAGAGDVYFVQAEKAISEHGVAVKSVLDHLKSTLNLTGKSLFLPMRIALTGEDHGPELQHIAALLGADGMIKRLKQAAAQVREIS